MICPVCQKEFEARPRRGRPQTYCSVFCRRVLEGRRRVWDVREAWARRYELASENPKNPKEKYPLYADMARKIRERIGERP